MQNIGRYELVEKLGQGGMGAVFRARDTLLERTVAVKVISATIDQNDELRERFFREARAAGQLSHKNIITIHDLGEHEGQPYLAMEYLQGQDLLARMASPQRMSLRRRVEIAIEIAIPNPPVNRVSADPELTRERALAPALLQVMPE